MLGVPVHEIDRTIRMAVAGLNIGTFRKKDGDKVNINVTLPRGNRQTYDAFGKVYVSSINGASIPLSQLADIRFETSPTTIKRYDKDRFTV
jgi:Cation/multidrug efflux pump